MKIGRRIVAALGLAGVIVAVILWQWLTAPVEWGPVDSMIRQAGQNLVSCSGSLKITSSLGVLGKAE